MILPPTSPPASSSPRPRRKVKTFENAETKTPKEICISPPKIENPNKIRNENRPKRQSSITVQKINEVEAYICTNKFLFGLFSSLISIKKTENSDETGETIQKTLQKTILYIEEALSKKGNHELCIKFSCEEIIREIKETTDFNEFFRKYPLSAITVLHVFDDNQNDDIVNCILSLDEERRRKFLHSFINDIMNMRTLNNYLDNDETEAIDHIFSSGVKMEVVNVHDTIPIEGREFKRSLFNESFEEKRFSFVKEQELNIFAYSISKDALFCVYSETELENADAIYAFIIGIIKEEVFNEETEKPLVSDAASYADDDDLPITDYISYTIKRTNSLTWHGRRIHFQLYEGERPCFHSKIFNESPDVIYISEGTDCHISGPHVGKIIVDDTKTKFSVRLTNNPDIDASVIRFLMPRLSKGKRIIKMISKGFPELVTPAPKINKYGDWVSNYDDEGIESIINSSLTISKGAKEYMRISLLNKSEAKIIAHPSIPAIDVYLYGISSFLAKIDC